MKLIKVLNEIEKDPKKMKHVGTHKGYPVYRNNSQNKTLNVEQVKKIKESFEYFFNILPPKPTDEDVVIEEIYEFVKNHALTNKGFAIGDQFFTEEIDQDVTDNEPDTRGKFLAFTAKQEEQIFNTYKHQAQADGKYDDDEFSSHMDVLSDFYHMFK